MVCQWALVSGRVLEVKSKEWVIHKIASSNLEEVTFNTATKSLESIRLTIPIDLFTRACTTCLCFVLRWDLMCGPAVSVACMAAIRLANVVLTRSKSVSSTLFKEAGP